MMQRDKLVKIKPPIILLVLIIGAVLLHQAASIRGIFRFQDTLIGYACLGFGVGLMVWAYRLIQQSGTTIIPAEKPTVFVAEGPYKFTRNPMYLAAGLFTFGLAVLMGTLPFYLVWIGMFLVLNFIHIPFEEKQLEEAFGGTYRDYKTRVRRWI